MRERKYLILAYYLFTPIEDPSQEVAAHHAFFQGRDATGRIYISTEGINGQMSAQESDARAYMEWLQADPRFSSVHFKIHRYFENVFPRMTVKVRPQLVALDVPVDSRQKGEHVSPRRWRQMLEERGEDTLLLDVRNAYEWEIGHFSGSTLPELETFREFPAFAQELKKECDPQQTRVMMYCTGGIRCELYSALLKAEGFNQVYQLQGGVINYGLEEGAKHWEGKLFVFDDRLAVPISEREPSPMISHCRRCNAPSDTYYNCANMDCNELFIACSACAQELSGCCGSSCLQGPRVRPFIPSKQPKPFRRKNEPISLFGKHAF